MKTNVPSASQESWAKFLKEIGETREVLNCKGGPDTDEAWFRGHSCGAYQLLPSLFRPYDNRDNEKVWAKIWGKESDLFWEFWARARELHGVIEDDWDILFAMQHYGTPTRLLDWTEVLGVAVYFATLGVDESNPTALQPPCVWVLNPYGLNTASTGHESDLFAPRNLGWEEPEEEDEEGQYYTYSELLAEPCIDWDWPLAIYPRQRNPRLHAQRAWFTIHGDEFWAMETINGRENYLRSVELPFEAIPAAREFLEIAGIDHYLLFADLEALSLRLVEKNGLLPREEIARRARQRSDRREGVPQRLEKR